MSLDGLRAWIAEVERKLAVRTRVFLALAVIAIGIGAAGVYLAIDARDNSVSKDDVRELQQQLETQIGETTASAPSPVTPPGEETAPNEPAPEAEPEAEPKSGKSKGGNGGASSSGTSGTPDSGTGAAKAQLQELVEQAEQHGAGNAAKQAGE
jgi:hypothetical protein